MSKRALFCGAGVPPAFFCFARRSEKSPARRRRHERPAFFGGSDTFCRIAISSRQTPDALHLPYRALP